MSDVTADNRSVLQKMLDLYVYSSLHIGLCAFAITAFGFLWIDLPIDLTYCCCVGFATLALYSIHRLVGINKVEAFQNKGRYRIIKQYKSHIWIYFGSSGLITLYTFNKLSPNIQWILIVLGLVSVSYTLPIFNGKRLRDFNYIKIFLIALVWTALCFILPAYMSEVKQGNLILVYTASVMYFVSITLPFDIRDVGADQKINVETIPTRLGAQNAKRLALLLNNVGFALLIVYGSVQGYTVGLYAWMTTMAISYALVKGYHEEYEDWYCNILLDGTIGMHFITFVLFNLVFSFF